MALIQEKWLDPSVRAKLAVDIQGTATIANNQTSAANLTGLLVDKDESPSAKVDYAIIRQYSGGYLHEAGSLYLVYDLVAEIWRISANVFGGTNAGVELTITAGGQVQYTSSNVAGTAVINEMSFYCKYL